MQTVHLDDCERLRDVVHVGCKSAGCGGGWKGEGGVGLEVGGGEGG